MRHLALLPAVLLLTTAALAADPPKPAAPAEPAGTVVIPAEKVRELADMIWACGLNKQACLQTLDELQKLTVKPPAAPAPAPAK